jgi:hypothetical protein
VPIFSAEYDAGYCTNVPDLHRVHVRMCAADQHAERSVVAESVVVAESIGVAESIVVAEVVISVSGTANEVDSRLVRIPPSSAADDYPCRQYGRFHWYHSVPMADCLRNHCRS